ncbi:MAG: glycosyltransferase family 4 protein [Alphaproteobacteria bacterium]|nr:glycosyltransferase family 4 protein [Alphaproteobacteria bacterium]
MIHPPPASRKILYLVTEDWYFASHRLPIARAARDAGWRVIVATRVREHGDILAAEGFDVIPLPWRRSNTSMLSLALDILALTRIYRREKPDLVHHVSLKPVLVGAAAARLAGVKRVVNAITGFGFALGGSGAGHETARSRLMRVLPLLTKRRNSILLLQNSDDLSFALSQGLAEPGQTDMIRGSGVDTVRYQPLLEPDGPGLTLGYAGRMLKQKGVEDLVAAFRIARRDRPDLRLLLAGRPDPENPASLTTGTLSEWDSEDGITWMGHIEDVRILWRRADIACLPSRGGEGVPKSLLEAGACGRPVIATDVPGCREVVAPDTSGVLVPPNDPEALARAILALAENAERRRQFAVAIRDRVENHFAEPAIVEKTLALYDRLAEQE